MATDNPFLPTFGTSPPMLAGRDDVVARFNRAFDRGPVHPDSTMLISGVRGSGKTVLLNEAEDAALRRGWRVISVSASSRELCQLIINAALLHLREAEDGKPSRRIASVNVMGMGVAWTVQPGSEHQIVVDLRSALTSLTERLASSGSGLLVTVDELQAAERAEVTDLAVAVQHITRRELLPMAFVAAALPEIDDTLLMDRGMTFFQRCARARLHPLERDDTRAALQVPIARHGGRIDDDALELATNESGGHPFTIQVLGYHTWEMAADERHITLKQIQAAAVETKQTVFEQIVKPIWNGLSEMDRSFLYAMAIDEADSDINQIAARIERTPNFAQTYRRRLIDVGAIEPSGRGRVRYVHKSLGPWLRSQ